MSVILVADRVFRIGRQRLYHDPFRGRWYVRLTNRSVDYGYEVPREKAPLWRRALA